MQIHFKAFEIWIHKICLFAVTIQHFFLFYFSVNINSQICMVLAIFKSMGPFFPESTQVWAFEFFEFSPILLFSANSWNYMEWDTFFYFAAQFWKSWVARAIVQLQDQLVFHSDKA